MDQRKEKYSFCIEFARLIKDYPDILRFSLEHFRKNPAPWMIEVESVPPPSKRMKILASHVETLESVFLHLQTFSNHFRNSWKWSNFVHQFMITEDIYSKWLFCQCLSVVVYMTEQKRHSFISNFFSSRDELVNSQLHYFQKEITGDFCLSDSILSRESEITSDFKHLLTVSKRITNTVVIGDTKLTSVGDAQPTNLVLVDSTANNLDGLALAVSAGKPVCLCGPVGCGKTALVQHLAAITGYGSQNRLYQVQLGEEMDSKLLLGSYKCTDVPGEFVWQPGVLTKAVIDGDWLLFEDIDTATNDVVTLLVSLIERNMLNVPGYRDNIVPAPGFQIFFTQRFITSISGYFQQNLSNIELLRKYWVQLNVEPLSKNELIQLIDTKFPILKTISSRMVDVFLLFSVGSHTKDDQRLPSEVGNIFGPKGRLTSTRDLLKWCSRVIINYDVKSQESALNVIQNAIDIFCCNVADEKIRLNLACAIAAYLGVVKTKADYFCNIYKPKIIMDKNRCIAGRATLERSTKLFDEPASLEITGKLYFAMTRPACCLMERIACCLSLNEPVLLVGETGTGKTSTLQLLARHTGNTLVVLNMNQQSDSTDLLGGYKPVDVKYVVGYLREEFEELFRNSLALVPGNIKFLNHISNSFNRRDWGTLVKLMKHVKNTMVCKKDMKNESKLTSWRNFGDKLERLDSQLKHNRALAFAFIEGALIRALRQGQWVLLDEINLASAETLQSLSGLLEEEGTVSLYEKGDFRPVKRHPNFRLMAAMNPATDVGKKQLPFGIRNRFTEFFVDELTNRTDLITLIACYLRELSSDKIDAIAKFYLKVRSQAQMSLMDGTGHKPHYSLRTLCRALSAVAANPCRSLQRSLYEGFCLSFLTQLDSVSREDVIKLIVNTIIGIKNLQSILGQLIPEPEPVGSHVCFEGYWVSKGTAEICVFEKYILTSTVKKNLEDLVRVVSLSSHPVLLQGDTSVGKTSLISYLAAASGNRCLRINNHEHTDLQEYIGTYSVDIVTGQLVFKEGVLVEAMRHGYWIILDELNLAPSDVLEALNRVLDDNRELYIPETQVTVKADRNFRLFATQNPPGLYGGRKILSRAFRNRFIELHFGEIPSAELEVILQKRCDMPASYTKKIVAVMKELQAHRRSSAAFAGKQGFITLRDLFRWGERYKMASIALNKSLYDWDQHIADEGFLVLAGRVRKVEETEVVITALEKHIKRKVDVNNLFTLSQHTSTVTKNILETIMKTVIPGFEHIVWTFNLRKLAVLVGKAIEFQEPILLVGDTGCGKTTVCQFIAALRKQKLFIVNCHQHSESSDFLGGLRPIRGHSENDSRLFEWVDGPLIEAMKNGFMFLADEISLADDSVLERMNSLLEPERTLLLSEKSSNDLESGEVITAHPSFFFLSTMNPGGDYGKKELSPALRNRLTEIWSENCTDRDDLIAIIEHNVKEGISFGNQEDCTSGIGKLIVDFVQWFQSQEFGKRTICSIRDLLLWVKFINIVTRDESEIATESAFPKLTLPEAYMHGAHLVLLDGLGTGLSGNYQEQLVKSKRELAVEYLLQQIKIINSKELNIVSGNISSQPMVNDYFGIHPFYINRGNLITDKDQVGANFTFQAKTTCENLIRLLRSLQLSGRAVLLEGSPGVGKTTLVQALATAAGYCLTRINLSEQTDVSDLFGADLPVDGADGGVFAWRDGPFLKALKDGHWILLDELNLASQSVLEGLNAVLDHRGELFVPELGKSFTVNSSTTRLFACQNPLRQGGARKGLPASFLNRFTQVYMEPLEDEDLLFVLSSLHPELPSDLVNRMVQFNTILSKECGIKWALRGAPWEINLRDLMKWCDVMKKYSKTRTYDPGRFVALLYANRMRTMDDKQKVLSVYEDVFGPTYPLLKSTDPLHVTPEFVIFGDVVMNREKNAEVEIGPIIDKRNSNLILRNQLDVLRSLAICVEMNWFVILVGNGGSGKTSVVQTISQTCNKKLDVLSVNSAMDTMEILGGFEQVDYNRHLEEIAGQMEEILFLTIQLLLTKKDFSCEEIVALFEQWENFKGVGNKDHSEKNDFVTLANETELFKSRISAMSALIDTIGKYKYFDEKISKMQIKLQKLTADIQKMGSLNSGGKFEWVDSVLIKCLTEGRWLLVENVNLCSPAILDRLNGLLEPGGVLTLGEKGVDNNGNLVTVVPHPDFRLFFTMDSQRGEISRAMRNRGVEISLQPIDDDLDRNIMDIMAILRHRGLVSHSSIVTLLNVYFTVRNLNIGLDQVSVGHLTHACFLLVQHHRRYGRTLSDSLKIVCPEVFLKSRSLSYEQQEIVLNVITDTINSVEHTSHIPPFYVTLNTQNLLYNSALYSVQSQGAMLSLFVHLMSTNQLKSDFNDILFLNATLTPKFQRHFDFRDVNFQNVLLYSLSKFYEVASPNDVKFRFFWLSHVLNYYSMGSDLITLNENISTLIANEFIYSDDETPSMDRKYLPWDLRRMSKLLFYSDDDMKSNKFSLLINYMLLKHRCLQIEGASIDSKLMDVNLCQYSLACTSGNIPMTGDSDELLTYHFNTLTTNFDKFFAILLHDESLSVDNEKYEIFLRAFQHYSRFTNTGSMPFFSRSSSRVNNYVLNYLRIHFKWLLKWIRKLTARCNNSDLNINTLPAAEDLFKIVSTIEAASDFALFAVLSFSKKLKRKMGQPLPVNVIECETNTNKFASWITCSNRFEENLNDFRNYLCDVLATEKENDNLVQKIWDGVVDAKESTDAKTEAERSKNIDENIVYAHYKYPLEILPIFEAFYLKLETHYKHFMYSKYTNCRALNADERFTETVIPQITNVARDLRFIPIGHISLTEKPLTEGVSDNKLIMNWFSQIIKHARSFSTFSFKNYLRFRSDSKESNGDAHHLLEQNNLLSYHYPVFCTFGSEFMFTSNEQEFLPSLFIPSLKNYRNYQKMLNQLKELFWKNSVYLSHRNSSYLFNEIQNVVVQFRFFITSSLDVLNATIRDYDQDAITSVNTIDVFMKCLTEFISNKCQHENIYLPAELTKLETFLAARLKELAICISGIEKTNHDENCINQIWISIGKCWVLMGTIQFQLFSIFEIVDPVLKIQLQKSDCKDDLEYVCCRLLVESTSEIFTGYSSNFPYEQLYKTWKKEIQQKLDVFPEAFIRTEPEKYFFIIKTVQQYKNTVGSSETIFKLYSKMMEAFDSLQNLDINLLVLSDIRKIIKECNGWLTSADQFVASLSTEYAEYTDIITPIVYAVEQTSYGFTILLSFLTKMSVVARSLKLLSCSESAEIENICSNLFSFPRSLFSYRDVNLCFSEKVVQLLTSNPGDLCVSSTVTIKLTKSCLNDFCSVLNVVENTNLHVRREIWSSTKHLLDRVVYLWKLQEEKRQEQKQTEESLYVFKTRTLCETLSDEEEAKLRTNEFFNLTYERDFEMENETPDDEMEDSLPAKKSELLVTEDEMNVVCRIHTQLAKNFTYTDWVRPSQVSEKTAVSNILDSFCDRYCVFAAVLDKYNAALNEIVDVSSLPGVLLMTDAAHKFAKKDECCDFYHAADVEEVSLFYPVLIRVRNHAEELLKSWDDHPVLKKIIIVIDRIMSFEVTSPVSRFLTGADVLLKTLHEWEEVAHTGVSFGVLYEELVGLIFMWRKLEISYWKNALENVVQKMKKDTSKWWFHLYAVCSQYMDDEKLETCTFADLVTTYQKYIESATLGEFTFKLDLLLVFHCHYTNQPSTPRLKELCCALWNLHLYYRQFEEQITAHVNNLSAEVRKKLRNFVKITRWNDINYWSVAKTVEKTHEQLIKYIKEFQKILEMPVASAMNYIPNKNAGNSDNLPIVDGKTYLSKMKISSELQDTEKSNMRLIGKAKTLCKTTVLASKYESLLVSLNEFVASVKEDGLILNRMDIDRTAEKEKQKSLAKNLLQQKRKVIADLFKNLTLLGLSYSSGILIGRNVNFSVNFAYLKPIDVGELYSRIERSTVDEHLIDSWNGCTSDFLNSIAKQSQLKLALEKPHQDLGPRNTDRIKGFANHLLNLIIHQKNKLIEAANSLRDLEIYESVFPKLYDGPFVFDKKILQIKNKFVLVLQEAVYFYQQFLILLDCCPENESTMLPTPVVKLTDGDSSILYTNKSSQLWKELYGKTERHLQTVQGLKTKFFAKIVDTFEYADIYEQMVTKQQYEIIFGEKDKLEKICSDLKSIMSAFQCHGHSNVLCSRLVNLQSEFDDLLTSVNAEQIDENLQRDVDVQQCQKRVDNFRKKMLLVIQKLFKKYVSEIENVETGAKKESNLKKNHMKDEILKSLNDDLEVLDIAGMCKRSRMLIKMMTKQSAGLGVSIRRRFIEPLMPLLNQYRLLGEYIVTQYVLTFKVSSRLCTSLLSVFIDLTTKGFCIPSELLEDEKEGEKSKDKGGMGLADGEGVNDVSDQIESQDQVEGAQQEGQKEKDEQKDCKEEESGIEMSDDFGGKSFEMEKKEDEEEGSEGDDEDEDELDKEMGETGEGADTLDQQIWGDDSGDEEEEEAKENEVEDGRGEDMGDKQMGAKDERTKEYEEQLKDEKGDRNDKEKEINEMDDQKKDDDQIDPYHGKQDPLPEPEALDLPENLQLDDGEAKDDDPNEENPFDIDAMKEIMPPKEDATEEENENEVCEPEENALPENDEDSDEDNVGTKKNEENVENDKDEETAENEGDEKEDGGSKSEEKTGEEPKPEETGNEEKDGEDENQPSEDKPSQVNAEAAKDSADGSKDMVSENSNENENQKSNEESKADTSGAEQQGVGQADKPEADTNEGHSTSEPDRSQSFERGSREQKRKLKPGDSDTNRTLAEANELSKKRLKTVDLPEQPENEIENTDDFEEHPDESSLYKHIREAEKGAAETVDAATREQAEKQPVLDEEGDKEVKEDDKMDLDDDKEAEIKEDIPEKQSDKMKTSKRDKSKIDTKDMEPTEEEMQTSEIQVEGDFVETLTVERGLETTFHTLDNEDNSEQQHYLDLEYIQSLKDRVQEQLANWNQTPALDEATSAWELFSAITMNLSQELSEQLRLVLEPTQASRLKGDFRTGRRINMRKVIPYIASQFRKDKIWLRRTKPSKREYQIILAIDDSSSMSDNHSKELAFESVALVSKALSLIEAGELGVISFGERTRIIHPLGEPFTIQTGAKLIRDFTFDEVETKFADAVHTATGLFLSRGSSNRSIKSAQLLVIVSDGRGVSSEGSSIVKSAVRAARQAGIFIVFIIVENPKLKNSILDIRMPVFNGNKLVGIESYIDNFPFPFYLILRDINKLPAVLAEALQQWFELVTNSSD